MHRILQATLAGLAAIIALFGITTQAAFASNPHFISADAAFGSESSLDVTFKEAGLGDNQNISYIASADATAEYACLNGGGNHPKAANKETVSGPVSAEGTFSSGQNGQITGSLTLQPPGSGDFVCPNGQTLVLASVSYTNVAITDTTNSEVENISGIFSRVFYTFE